MDCRHTPARHAGEAGAPHTRSRRAGSRRICEFFFELSTWLLLVLLFVVIVGATVIGLFAGRAVRHRSADLREPFSVMQATLLGFMGLVLAFGLSLAVGRYETRRAAVVDEGNAIGTAYLRAQTIAEPE